MSTNAQAHIIAGPQAVDMETAPQEGEDITEETAARLQALCDETGEAFDGNLTERQALRRIAVLEEVHEPD